MLTCICISWIMRCILLFLGVWKLLFWFFCFAEFECEIWICWLTHDRWFALLIIHYCVWLWNINIAICILANILRMQMCFELNWYLCVAHYDYYVHLHWSLILCFIMCEIMCMITLLIMMSVMFSCKMLMMFFDVQLISKKCLVTFLCKEGQM